MGHGTLYDELRRRKVIRVAVVYVIAAIAVINAAALILPALLLPEWSYRLVVVLAILGFPLVLALAWSFDLTPEGLQRTAPAEPPEATFRKEEPPGGTVLRSRRPTWTARRVGLMSALVVLGLAGAAILAARRGPAVIEYRIAVLPFEDRTGDPRLSAFGAVAADWITDGLTTIDTVQVVPVTAAEEVVASTPAGADPVPLLARRTQAGLVVTGSYALVGDSVEVRAQLVDSRQGRIIGSVWPTRGRRTEPTGALTGIREQVLGHVAMHLDVRLRNWAVSGKPPTYEAYQAYVAGNELFLAARYRGAIQAYDRALAADSTFHAAAFRIAVAYGNLDMPAQEDSVLRLFESHRSELSEVERLTLDWGQAYLRGDLQASHRLSLELFRRAPSGTWRYVAALYALRTNHPREAVSLLREEPEGSIMRTRRFEFHSVLASALYVLDEHGEELEAAREARALFPDRPGAVYLEARALAALGRPGEAETRVTDLLAMSPDMGASDYITRIGDALAAEGYGGAAARVYDQAVGWWHDHAPTYPVEHESYADALRLAGRLDEAEAHARRAHGADPGDPYAHALVGIIAGQRGDRGLAERVDAELAARDDPYDRGLNAYNRACIRARLGDGDRAVELIRRAYAQGQAMDDWIRIDPDMRPLHGFRAFEELIRPKG